MSQEFIEIKNARVHNLKGIDINIPLNKFVVITGLSGSGKSSLAFDTLYAEGQRRYVESLSSYVRQFLGRMNKPEVDFIKGIPPAIAIEQKVINNNPRSTVGTTTEIYEYLKLMYARIGRTFSPKSGKEVKRHTVDDVIQHIASLPTDTTATIVAHIPQSESEDTIKYLQRLSAQGFSRVETAGQYLRITDLIEEKSTKKLSISTIRTVIDRVRANDSNELKNRLYDSIETAFYDGNDECTVIAEIDGENQETTFSKRFEADGITFELPSEQMFSFNNPIGACPVCDGYGKTLGIDPDLVIPDPSLSIYEDAVMCWRGPVMGQAKHDLILNAEKFNFPIHKPYYQLTDAQKDLIWKGNKYFQGLNDFFKEIESMQYKIQYRVMLARYRGKTTCTHCHGTRLKPESQYVKVGGKSITELVDMPISQLIEFFKQLKLNEHDSQVASRLLKEIASRLDFLNEVGLGYLTLNRQSNTLSGGESQRINLATSLGSALVGSLYVLDEPSIGLHSRDTQRLIAVLRKLQQLGNTVVVVEHDPEIMLAADHIIDIGPDAGRNGGRIVVSTPTSEIPNIKDTTSYTIRYLNGSLKIDTPPSRRKSPNYIELKGVTENNLKNLTVQFPLGVMTVVTGVSGSGKSSLVRTVLYNALLRELKDKFEDKCHYNSLTGSLHLLKSVELIDQNPIGKSSRSNPVTYIKAYDEIRKLFADQPMSKQMGYTAAHFSFNMDGGRCPVCQGEGTVTVPMQFMSDLVLTCEACGGKRFKNNILEIKYRNKNIHDVLEMTVNQAIEFFSADNDSTALRIAKRLKPLQDVGIGYIKLGQSSNTLSGGESQRVKLAYHLSQEKQEKTLFIFDEPTTGLHTHDIKTLMKAIDALISHGHTVVIIEHNLEVIKCADHIIDLGPEGGNAGGTIVATGAPEHVAKSKKSWTGMALKEIL